MKSKINFMNGNVTKNLFQMFIPLFLAMVLTMMYNLVDSLWVGNMLGETGYAALTSSTAFILILNGIAMGAGNGVSILIAQAVGKKDTARAEKIIATALIMATVFSVSVTIAAECFLVPILQVIGTPDTIMPDAYGYLSIYLLGYFLLFVYMQFSAIFRSYGDPVFQMKGMIFCTVINAIIDPVLIHWIGLTGAAWATVFSELICFIYPFIYLKKHALFLIKLKSYSNKVVIQILKNTVPAALNNCIPAISSATMVSLVSAYSLNTIAAYGITSKIEIFLFYPAMAMNMALTSIIGQCFGAKDKERTKQYLKSGITYGGMLSCVSTILVCVFAGTLSMLFVRSAEDARIVEGFFKIISVGYVCYMVTSCFLGKCSGEGKPEWAMLLMIIYYIIIRIPLAVMLSHTTLGLNGIWTAILVSHVAALIIAVLVSREGHQGWQERKVEV